MLKPICQILGGVLLGIVLPYGCFAQGSCPSGVPSGITKCYYIAATGSDSNSGTTENSPWLHAPGMPNCGNACAAVTPSAGEGFILRGGDTWHFGNSGAAPFTGGPWNLNQWWGNDGTCLYDGTSAGCIYWGVDPAWYSGGSWKRPVLTGDNPLSTALVTSCQYQMSGGYNLMVQIGVAHIFDNFEMTGLCSANTSGGNGGTSTYIQYGGTGIGGKGMAQYRNLYIHGWTATTTAGTVANAQPCTIFGGGFNGLQSFDHNVIDGQDSNPGSCAWATFPSFYHFRDNIVRYTNQGVGQWCHDIHDNIFEYMYNHNPGAGSHTNVLECNADSDGTAVNQPPNTPNVWYNNILRHITPGYFSSGQVGFWTCPNTMAEYWFNNLIYDTGAYGNGNVWAVAGAPIYSGCTMTGGQYMFNNTLSGANQVCHGTGSNTSGGAYTHVFNEHLINTPWDGTGCDGRNDSSNVSMTWATADSQGYTTGTAGITDADTCANESGKPCSPTAQTNATVGTGVNKQAYCNMLATYTSEKAIGTDAASACLYGTTDGCAYNTTTHTMNCPAQVAVAKPTSGNWDVGAYQFSAASGPPPGPMPPTSVKAITR